MRNLILPVSLCVRETQKGAGSVRWTGAAGPNSPPPYLPVTSSGGEQELDGALSLLKAQRAAIISGQLLHTCAAAPV